MANDKKPTWVDEYSRMVDECIQWQHLLTEWECSFVQSMRDWIDRGRTPTDKQVAVIDRVWEKVS